VAKRIALATLGVSVLAAFALGVGTAHAGLLGCNYGSETQAFSAWGDASQYVLVPGGSFEGRGTGGWSLSGGAKIVSGNEPFHLNGAGDSHSLLLPPGSSALTPGVCLFVLTPTLRFVGSASDGSGVHVTMYTRTLLGLVQLPSSADIGLDSSWGPSETQGFLLQNLLGLVNLGQSNIYFRFTPIGGATVQMDDVYLDPFFHF
jgi:hypothetical protein